MSDTERAAAARADPSGAAALRAILRIRPFRRLWLVLGLASLGDWLGLLATSIFAADQVQNPAAKGVAFGGVIAVRLLPALLLGPVAGVFADRFDRRYTMVACDLVRFVLFLSMPLSALVLDSGAAVIGWLSIATFLIESITMVWLPAKDAAVPNLLPPARLETANQLTLATTYGITPVAGALLLMLVEKGLGAYSDNPFLAPTAFSLFFLALTRLATAFVVLVGIKEISGRGARPVGGKGMLREFFDGWRYVGKTPLVRGLVLGILAAFASGGMVVGSARFYAGLLGGGDSTFYILFAMIFVGLAIGISVGPKLIGELSRRRWFGMSIALSGVAVALMAFAWQLSIAVACVILVGIGAGMAFLSGITLLGREVSDDLRGRVFGFVNMATRVVLMLAIALSSILVGLGSDLKIDINVVTISTTRMLLFFAGVVGVLAGVGAFRQMDDKPGVPVLADLWGSLRGRPISMSEAVVGRGAFVVFEGGEGAGKSTQAERLARALGREGRRVLLTKEPGATELGERIRELVLTSQAERQEPQVTISPRAEALLYAADRADHVGRVIRPAIAGGSVVISDRYIDSSLAYQGVGRGLPSEEISWLSAWATGGLKPDLVVVLDLDPVVGMARVSGRGPADRVEQEELAFHERVRYAFLDLAGAEPKRYLIVDAGSDPDQIAETVLARVRQLLPEHDRDSLDDGNGGGLTEQVQTPPPAAQLDPAEQLEPNSGGGRLIAAAHPGLAWA